MGVSPLCGKLCHIIKNNKGRALPLRSTPVPSPLPCFPLGELPLPFSLLSSKGPPFASVTYFLSLLSPAGSLLPPL